MASIQRRGRKWIVRWRDPDGLDRSRSCTTRATADEVRRDVEAHVERGERWEPRGARPLAVVREVAAAWLRSRAVRLAPRTLIRYGQMIEAWAQWMEARHGQRVHLGQLTRGVLEEYWRELTSGASGRWGVDRSVATARKHLEAVYLCWAWAYDREEWEGSVPRPRRLELPVRPTAPPALAPTWAQMDEAILVARGWLRCLLVVLRCTGLRVAQALGLRWEDLRGTLLTIRPELGKSQAEKHGRRIPIAPVLLAELNSSRLCAWDRNEPWIVPSRPPLGKSTRRSRDARARDAARVWARTKTPKDVWAHRPDHAFRKGFVTGLRAAGADAWAVEVLVGHRLPGEQHQYVDPSKALPLEAAVALVPPLPTVPA